MAVLAPDRPKHACHVKNCPQEVVYRVIFVDPSMDQAYMCRDHALTVKSNPQVKEVKEL